MLSRRLVKVASRQHQFTVRHASIRNLATVANPPKLPFDATCSSVIPPYEKLVSKLKTVKRVLDNEPLTLAEKILYSHLTIPEESLAAGKGNIRGQSYLKLNPDRVAMQGSERVVSAKSRCQCANGNIAIHG
jgi:homoaconitase